MKCTYPEVCIYYRESFYPTRQTCDWRDGEELKNLSAKEIEECGHFKSFKKELTKCEKCVIMEEIDE